MVMQPQRHRRIYRSRTVIACVLGFLVLAASVVGVVQVLRDRPSAAGAAPIGSASPTITTASATATVPAPSPTVPATAGPSATPAVAASRTTPRPPAGHSAKKGVSTWDFTGVGAALVDVRAAWYYNWSASPTGGAGTSAEFVPMIWGSGSVNTATLNKAKAAGKVLLGFNEPDFSSQSNMTVEQALDLWPQLQATGLRLGSPAPAINGAKAGEWLDRFITGARGRGYRVDFIALHWYGSDFSSAAVGQLRGYLQAVYDRYHLPIWLTEYALIKFGATSTYPTPAQQAAFVTNSTAMMQALPYVERYAWFALPTPKTGDETGLYRNGTTPTAAGAAYRAVAS